MWTLPEVFSLWPPKVTKLAFDTIMGSLHSYWYIHLGITLHCAPVSILNLALCLLRRIVTFHSLLCWFWCMTPMNMLSISSVGWFCILWRFGLFILVWQTWAIWFFFPHFWHSAPVAGQYCCLVCQPPHCSQASFFHLLFEWLVCLFVLCCSHLHLVISSVLSWVH